MKTVRQTPLDPRIDSPGREGLTGTARSSVYEPVAGGDSAVVRPAGLASTACLALNTGLLRYLRRLERAAARAGAR